MAAVLYLLLFIAIIAVLIAGVIGMVGFLSLWLGPKQAIAEPANAEPANPDLEAARRVRGLMSNLEPPSKARSTDNLLLAILVPLAVALFLFFVDSASFSACFYLSIIVVAGAFIFIVKPLPRFLLTRSALMLVVVVAIIFAMTANIQIKGEEDRLAQVRAEETHLAQVRAEEVRLQQLRQDNPESYLSELKAKNDPQWEPEFKLLNPFGFEIFVAERRAKEEQQRKTEIEGLLSQLKATSTDDIDTLGDTYARLATLDSSNRDYRNKGESLAHQIKLRDEIASLNRELDQKPTASRGLEIYRRLIELEPKNPQYRVGEKRFEKIVVEQKQMEKLVDVVTNARASYKKASTDFQKGATRPTRAKVICSVLRTARVNNWVGTVNALSTNGDGKGILSVEIGPDIYVQTWNNSLSDIGSNTLVDPDSSVFAGMGRLTKGAKIRFSGTFFPSNTDCVQETSMTLDGSLTRPEFLFRFSGVEP